MFHRLRRPCLWNLPLVISLTWPGHRPNAAKLHFCVTERSAFDTTQTGDYSDLTILGGHELPRFGQLGQPTDRLISMKSARSRYHGHRFPPEIIGYAVWV